MPDPGTPLCSSAQFSEGPFGDLASALSSQALDDFLLEATRECEDDAGRRLAPFTLTETHRCLPVDPHDYPSIASPAALTGPFAQPLTRLVRQAWLRQSPGGKYPDMWAYSGVTVTVSPSLSGQLPSLPATVLYGPETDTGHLLYDTGQRIPPGSRAAITYSGGYVVAIPASLVRACKYMCAYHIIRELNPEVSNHDPDQLLSDALSALEPWGADGSPAAGRRGPLVAGRA